MRRKPGPARIGCLLVTLLCLARCGGPGSPVAAQQPDRSVEEERRKIQERSILYFGRESRPKIASARKSWSEGRPADAARELEGCLDLARTRLGDLPNAPSVEIVKALARLRESTGSFRDAESELRRALDMQRRLTGPQSWEALELKSEVGRLDRLGKLGRDRIERLTRLGPTVALLTTSNQALASAVCIDPRGLFLTRARPLSELKRTSTTHFEYHPRTHEIIGLRTDVNEEESPALFLVLNPRLPDQAVFPARLVRTAAHEDLALLAVRAGRPLPATELARDHEPAAGEEAVLLNHWNSPVASPADSAEPIQLRACPTRIAAARSLEGRPWVIQLGDPMPPGGSEGPVVDGRGRLIGLAIRGLPGTGLSYTIPARVLASFVGRGVVLESAPFISYLGRKREQEWAIPILLPEPEARGAELEVILDDGDARRSFRGTADPGRGGAFVVRLTPVDPDASDRVDLVVGRGRGATRYRVDDRPVTIGRTRLRLSEVRRLELGPEPRGFAADGRTLAGPLGGLGGLEGEDGGSTRPVELGGATSLSVVYPPEPAEPLPGELVVRSGGQVLLRERFSVGFREPLVDLGGVLDVSSATARPGPPDPPAPIRANEDRVFMLGGKVGVVAEGVGGRYLLLALRDRRELIVFDAFSRQVAARVPLADDDVLLAAGADAMLLVYPGLRIIHRWDLRRMALDRTAALPIRGEVKAVALGAASAGPMLVHWVEKQSGGKFSLSDFSFIDPESLKVRTCESIRERRSFAQRDSLSEVPEPGVFRLGPYTGDGPVNLRASPRGDVFGLWGHGSPRGFCTLALRGRSARAFEEHVDHGHLIPGQDGRSIFSGSGQRFDLGGKPLVDDPAEAQRAPAAPKPKEEKRAPTAPKPKPAAQPWLVPSAEPAYYLAIDGPSGRPAAGAETKVVLRARALGLGRDLGTFEVPWQDPSTANPTAPGAPAVRRPDDDQRFHWTPDADLMVAIPPTDDRLVLHPFRLDEAIRDDDLFVTSPRGMDVVLGRPFRRAIVAGSGPGRVEFALTRGPTGLTLSPVGEIGWDKPAGVPGDVVETVVEVRHAAGRVVTETFTLRLLAAGRAD